MNLVENIRTICSDRNMTVKEVEKAAGISANSIYKWDTNSPSIDKVAKIARVLQVPIDCLIEGRQRKECMNGKERT